MCCCAKPTINGEQGYRWNNPGGPTSIYPVNPPELEAGDTLLFDEPGRCGGLDSHSYHYRLIREQSGGFRLLVRHGGGDERVRISNGDAVTDALAMLDPNGRYWVMGAIYHAQSDAARQAREDEAYRWRTAAAQKRIKVRKQRGTDHVRVSIKPAQKPSSESIHPDPI